MVALRAAVRGRKRGAPCGLATWYNGGVMNDNLSLEFGFLADLVFTPERARHYAGKYALSDAAFYEPGHRAAFTDLVAETSADMTVLYGVLKRHVPGAADVPKLSECTASCDGEIADRACTLTKIAYRRELAAAAQRALANGSVTDPESLELLVREAVAVVPKPPCCAPDAVPPPAADVCAMPDELLHVPGFVDQLAAYTLKAAHRPNRPLAFAGALAMLAHLAGRHFRDPGGTCPNLYLVAIAETGAGKDAPRRTNKDLAAKVEIAGSVFDQIASGEAVEEALYQQPASLVQMDEIHTTLQAAKDNKNAVSQGIYRYLLSFYSESGSTHTMRLKVAAQARPDALIGRVVNDPHLTLFGTCVPHGFYQSLSLEALENGLVGRCLVVEGGKKGPLAPVAEKPALPPGVVHAAHELAARRMRRPWTGETEPQVVPFAAGVADALKQVADETDALCDEAESRADLAGQALWVRAAEKVRKLALLHALSANLSFPEVSLEGVRWARDFVFHCTRRTCEMAAVHITSGATDENCRRILQYFAKRRKNALMRSEVMRALHLDAKALSDAETTLVCRDQLDVIHLAKQSVQYKLRKNAT